MIGRGSNPPIAIAMVRQTMALGLVIEVDVDTVVTEQLAVPLSEEVSEVGSEEVSEVVEYAVGLGAISRRIFDFSLAA